MRKVSRFTFEPYLGGKGKHTCPKCHYNKSYKRYIDTLNEISLPFEVGRCDREVKCGYHLTPKEFLSENPDNKNILTSIEAPEPINLPPSFISADILNKSIAKVSKTNNNFVSYLTACFEKDLAKYLCDLYLIGTSKAWNKSTVFWQKDVEGNIRAGKIMLFDEVTGKRVKHCVNWVHSVLNMKDYNLKQCLFGEHLLTQFPKSPVFIVESESCAICMMALSLCGSITPGIWLATGGSSGCGLSKPETVSCLYKRNVTLFPDKGYYEKWKGFVKGLQKAGVSVRISNELEKMDVETNSDFRDVFVNGQRENGTGYVMDKGKYCFERFKIK